MIGFKWNSIENSQTVVGKLHHTDQGAYIY